MKKLVALVAVVCCLALNISAQHTEWCGTMKNAQRIASQNPEKSAEFDKFLQYIESLQHQHAAGDNSRDVNETTVFIPVVFHIVHNGDPVGTGENITDAQVLSQIDAMNRDFNGEDPDILNIPSAFTSRLANVNVRFCLARLDPFGNPTTGIERIQYAQSTWDTEDDIDNVLKPATIWDRNYYLNIWSIRMGGSLLNNGVLAYSSFPFFGSADADGIIARFNTIGTTGTVGAQFKKGKTITHEVGHWLGLLHTWGTDAGCGDQGDFVADTPDQDDANFGCPDFPLVSCPAAAPNGDMFMNYMDYTDDDCRNMFTIGQSNNMWSVINGFRATIKTAATQCFYNLDVSLLSIKYPIDTVCTGSFAPMITIRNEGLLALTNATIFYQIDGGATQAYNWTGNLSTQEQETVFLPAQNLGDGPHSLAVTISNPNGQSADAVAGNNTQFVSFYVFNSSTASALPFTEGFENNVPPADWSIINPNNDVTWANDFNGGYGNSNTSVMIDNFSYIANPNRKRDALVTPAYDFTNIQYPELKFDLAYARRSTTRFDTLIVYYSLNCGSNWTKLWSQFGSQMATSADKTTFFIPTSSEWKTVSIPLLSLKGYNRVSFRFENVTGWGNALYLDNVNIQNNQSLPVADVSETVDMKVFPNPASNLVAVRINSPVQLNTAQVINQLGEVVRESALSNNSTVIELDNLPSGMYLVKVSGDNVTASRKLILTK